MDCEIKEQATQLKATRLYLSLRRVVVAAVVTNTGLWQEGVQEGPEFRIPCRGFGT